MIFSANHKPKKFFYKSFRKNSFQVCVFAKACIKYLRHLKFEKDFTKRCQFEF